MRCVRALIILLPMTGLCACAGDRLADARAAIADTVADADSLVALSDLDARKSMCAKESGRWVQTLVVAPCEGGKTTLTLDGEAHTLSCADGKGVTDTGVCTHTAPDGGVYYND